MTFVIKNWIYLHTSNVCVCVCVSQDELLAELERLEKNLDETPLEMDRTEERVPFLAESSTASLSSAGRNQLVLNLSVQLSW